MNQDNLKKINKNEVEAEIVDLEEIKSGLAEKKEEQSVKLSSEGIEVKKSGNFVIGSLNLIGDSLRKRNKIYYQSSLWHLVADIALILLVIALIIFSSFSFNFGKKDEKISLKINLDDQNISAGQLKTFELEYKVHEDLKNNSISVELPRNFVLESVSPNNYYNQEKNTFYLDDLSEGTSGKIKIDGYILGEQGDHQMMAFKFNCNKCGKNGIVSSHFYNISRYLLDFRLELPEKIYSNTEIETKLIIKNNASRELNNLQINLADNLKIKKSDLRITNEALVLEKIEARQEKEFLLYLNISDEENIKLSPKISFNFLDDRLHSTWPEINKTISQPEMKFNLSTNQSLFKNGEKISYKLRYENQDSQAIKDISFRLNSAQLGLFLSSVEILDTPKNIKLEGNAIKIEDLIPGEKGELDLLVLFERRQVIANQEALLVADIEYQINNQGVKYTAYSSAVKIASEVLADVSARYYSQEGDQLGVGPLPPAVDMATNYWLFLEFNNSGNDLKDFILTAELPDNVYFSGNKRVLDGILNYAEIGKRIIWEIPQIESGTNKYRANLEISLIPEQADLGKVLDLVKNIKFTVYDQFTQEEISGTLKNINTNLEKDRFSSGKGSVKILR